MRQEEKEIMKSLWEGILDKKG